MTYWLTDRQTDDKIGQDKLIFEHKSIYILSTCSFKAEGCSAYAERRRAIRQPVSANAKTRVSLGMRITIKERLSESSTPSQPFFPLIGCREAEGGQVQEAPCEWQTHSGASSETIQSRWASDKTRSTAYGNSWGVLPFYPHPHEQKL